MLNSPKKKEKSLISTNVIIVEKWDAHFVFTFKTREIMQGAKIWKISVKFKCQMCKHRISIFFAQNLHGTLEYGSTQTVEVQEGSEKKSKKRGGLDRLSK